jgi:hypothetical protein
MVPNKKGGNKPRGGDRSQRRSGPGRIQGYLAHKKHPPPRITVGPQAYLVPEEVLLSSISSNLMYRFRAKREQLQQVQERSPDNQGKNLALTVLHVPDYKAAPPNCTAAPPWFQKRRRREIQRGGGRSQRRSGPGRSPPVHVCECECV